MRIVVVSAHFPPNFVSGGTLQPQRLARGLRARGHDVSVYAGWLDNEREPGTAWDEHDDTGLPVRWIVSTPWTRWDDRLNFDNPTVAEDFARHLDDVRPDLVHFHALQSFGGRLLEVASLRGAAVVVTMHDFWWCCARQFLVERDGRPCAEVVDAGVCPCEVDRDWLLERNAWLRDQLSRADLVLAPSASAAGMLAANGLGDRLTIDENGIPSVRDSLETRKVTDEDAPVRFLYAGGSDPLKGVDVLLDACEQLRAVDGWHLVAYGAYARLAERGITLEGLPVDVLSPYPSEDTSAVLSAADVLVLPSLTRESYSLLTRDALRHGLAVVSSDCLGPEEVIVDGHNGLIVPTGDSTALASAMQRMLTDHELRARALETATTVEIRSLDDQVHQLDARFQALVWDTKPSRPPSLIRRVLFIVGIQGAPLRYRVRLPAEGLGLLGMETDVRWFTDPALRDAVTDADAVVVYRAPATAWLLEVIEHAHHLRLPVVFDADDLIFDPDVVDEIPALTRMTAEGAAHWLEGVRRYRTTMECCDAFIASTPALARHASAVTGLPSERFDNGVGLLAGRVADLALRRPRERGPLRLGYFSGTDTHDHDWQMIEPAVEHALIRHPELELWLGGVSPTAVLDGFSRRVRRVPFEAWPAFMSMLRDVDINLAPLVANQFNEAKSAIKWLEAALVATPTIASPTEPFRDAIDHGTNGLLASSAEDWFTAIDQLVRDHAQRERLGRRARRNALMRWSPHLQARRYREILENVQPRGASESSWVPVLGDEARRVVDVERYVVTPEQQPSTVTRALKRVLTRWRG